MAFISLGGALKQWKKRKGLVGVFKEKEILSATNEYLRTKKKWLPALTRAVSFKQGILMIKCQKGAVSSELRQEEREIIKYLSEISPEIKKIGIRKIFYKII